MRFGQPILLSLDQTSDLDFAFFLALSVHAFKPQSFAFATIDLTAFGNNGTTFFETGDHHSFHLFDWDTDEVRISRSLNKPLAF